MGMGLMGRSHSSDACSTFRSFPLVGRRPVVGKGCIGGTHYQRSTGCRLSGVINDQNGAAALMSNSEEGVKVEQKKEDQEHMKRPLTTYSLRIIEPFILHAFLSFISTSHLH